MHIEARSGFPYDVIVTVATGYLLGVVGGKGLMMDSNWGMYPLSAGALVILVRTVLTARELLFGRVRAPDPDTSDMAEAAGNHRDGFQSAPEHPNSVATVISPFSEE